MNTCKYGIYCFVCSSANKYLLALGLKPLTHTDNQECRTLLTTIKIVAKLTKAHRVEVSVPANAWFHEIGLEKYLNTKYPPPPVVIDFTCPTTHMILTLPCNLKQCKYHVNFPFALNCLLAYMVQHNVEILSPQEIAYLYQIDPDKIPQILDEALKIVRSNEAKSQITTFEFIDTRSTCYVCESNIEEDLGYKFPYCCESCMTEKPEHVLQLEVQYGNDIEPILQQMLAQFNDVDILSRTLGITPEQLDELCEQYFSCKALDYNMSGQQAKATEQANDYSKIINEIKAIADKLARELPAIFELRLSHE